MRTATRPEENNALCLLAKKIVLMYLSALELTEEVVK
jgi:hypothetical protein